MLKQSRSTSQIGFQTRTLKESCEKPNMTTKCQRTALDIKELIKLICVDNEINGLNLSDENRNRLKFLHETLDLIIIYLGEQRQQSGDYTDFLGCLLGSLSDALGNIKKIYNKNIQMTIHFDIYELVLRRKLAELESLFPISGNVSVKLSIEDDCAREFWLKNFEDRIYVDYDTFIKAIKTLTDEPDIISGIEYFVNFPRDNMISSYRWNILIRWFGPFECFINNFRRLLAKGFTGLVNRIRASELLRLEPVNSILIRFSRTEPDYLAMSIKKSNGQIEHHTNRTKDHRLIPIVEYIEDTFRDYHIVNYKVDLREISKCGSLSQYSLKEGGYITNLTYD